MNRDLEQLAARLAGALERGRAGILEFAALALAERRGLEPGDAARALAVDEMVGRLLAAEPPTPAPLAGRVLELAGRAGCIRCAACCRTSSPTLYAEDAPLLGPDGPGRGHFYTLRAGETALNHRTGRAEPLENELIKVREQPGRGCVFLGPEGCAVHGGHPLQCRHLECWSGRHAGDLADRPRLTRAQVFAGRETALALAAEYDLKLSAADLARALEGARRGEEPDAARALEMIALDQRLRRGIGERYGIPAAELPLLLGRPALEVARAYGLAPSLDGRGRPCLAPASR